MSSSIPLWNSHHGFQFLLIPHLLFIHQKRALPIFISNQLLFELPFLCFRHHQFLNHRLWNPPLFWLTPLSKKPSF